MNALDALGWAGVLALAGGLGLVFGGVRLAVLAGGGLAALGVLGLWEASMATLALMLAAVASRWSIGIPLGILAGRSNACPAVLTPILDVMQIMPTFAYLAPMTLLFLIGVAVVDDRHADLRDPASGPDHGPGHPRGARQTSKRRSRSAHPMAVLTRSSCRSPGGRSGSRSTRRS